MRINHNIAALNTYRQFGAANAEQSKSMEKLSSGLRINRAGDDAAGLAISEKMRGQVRGLDRASANAQDSISMIQTAEGALNETQSILQRMRELSVQSSNDTATDADRSEIQKEVSQLKDEIDRIANTTEFNTKKLLNGSLSAAKESQGTVAASDKFDVSDIAATAGSTKAGGEMTIKEAVSSVNGTGYSQTGNVELAEKTVIKAGVNQGFDITINGQAYTNLTIAESTGDGYSREDFAKAIEDAINTKVGTNASLSEKVSVSVTSDNKLKMTTADTGKAMTFTLAGPTTATNGDARAAMGIETDYETGLKGSVDISSGITFADADASKFSVTLGGKAADIDLAFGATTQTKDAIVSTMQAKIDAAFGENMITVGTDEAGKITLNTADGVRAGALEIKQHSSAGTTDGHTELFGGEITTGQTTVAVGAATEVKGTNSINGRDAGTVISSGVNDQFSIAVDGGNAVTLTLDAGTYATKEDLVNEINNRINSNDDLVGKVKASLNDSGELEFTSASKGADSSVSVTAPSTAGRSALGALGLAGSAGNIDGTVNIATGFDLASTATNQKTTVTLGNKSAVIDLSRQKDLGINTNTGAAIDKSSRDAIVKALQAELDNAFGENAITVGTAESGGTEKLKFTVNTGASKFEIKDVDGTQTMALSLLGAGTKTATVSADPSNTVASGTDAVDQSIDNSTKLTSLVNKDGNNLGLTTGNVVKFSGTQNGQGFEASFTVTESSTVGDLLNEVRKVAELEGATVSLDTTNGQIRISGEEGSTNDLSNLKFQAQKSATDTSAVGAFNRAFEDFNVTQQAQDAKSDSSLSMQIGANQGQTLNVDINEMSTSSLRIQDIDLSTQGGAATAITVIDNAIQTVSTERSKLGAYQNRLEHTINNLGTSSENLTAAEARIRDVDYALAA